MTAGETGWAALTELAGPLGLVLLAAAVLVAAVLEVLDERADARTAHDAAVPRRHRHAAPRSHRTAWLALRVSLVVLVLAALAATAARVLPVLGS
ncbi:hypothetical protein [Blastococcus xanthinilyticus]|uniref:Uncharacterized protein n=1 Tax=Blastococcus xanthinilyticus TaxID=1564164 RepID=A0A5S5CW58_9ACTN|nr:hypothetical protein [Blastococcus xanthinilyticus]TYP87218.1 hypothetical protein BD833_107158 [Blastococcus xanthinilyticus]